MDDLTTNRVIEILESDPDFFVPVKKLWLMLQEEDRILDTPLEDFHQALLADERFEFTTGLSLGREVEDVPAFAQEIESLGFYNGPRVKLASREMTVEDVFSAMVRSLAQMNKSLQNAWEARPEGDQETADQLLKILASGQKLERDIQKLADLQDQDKV